METITVDAADIDTPHDVNDSEKFDELVASMSESGWDGRDILVVARGSRYQALTGSHRVAAALEAGIDVPCTVLDADDDLLRTLDNTNPDDLASVLVDALGEDHEATQLAMEE